MPSRVPRTALFPLQNVPISTPRFRLPGPTCVAAAFADWGAKCHQESMALGLRERRWRGQARRAASRLRPSRELRPAKQAGDDAHNLKVRRALRCFQAALRRATWWSRIFQTDVKDKGWHRHYESCAQDQPRESAMPVSPVSDSGWAPINKGAPGLRSDRPRHGRAESIHRRAGGAVDCGRHFPWPTSPPGCLCGVGHPHGALLERRNRLRSRPVGARTSLAQGPDLHGWNFSRAAALADGKKGCSQTGRQTPPDQIPTGRVSRPSEGATSISQNKRGAAFGSAARRPNRRGPEVMGPIYRLRHRAGASRNRVALNKRPRIGKLTAKKFHRTTWG